ncbi:MAG TPA: penicillin acylase family protein [Vicinamibacteria bacterium]|nr:penicillin acylase family protein [Vicinamibacteria bacterium]
MRWLRGAAALLLALAVAVSAAFVARARRALPLLDGTRAGASVSARVEIVRDRFGVPHIFAQSDDDAYFALGFCHGQDRLFQMDVLRHVGQGRLSEVFGKDTLKVDRLFRTLDLHGVGRRMMESARPEAQRALVAYARGVNLAAREASGRALPIEFSILGRGFAAARADDFLGILGYMAWGLEMSWTFDPLVERLVAKVGPERAAELLPWNFGGEPSVHPSASEAIGAPAARIRSDQPPAELSLFELSPFETQLLSTLPALRASNNWVLGPGKTTTGRPILANDPHLSHGLPPIWYEAHLVSPTLDVAGVTIPGLPLVAIGRNRDVAWGMTNVMLDGGDFFVEKVEGARVLHRGAWVDLEERVEEIRVRGGGSETLAVRSTPHGPLVGKLLQDEPRALAYRWNFRAALDANEIDGFYLLNRARDWPSFREALSRFGAIAQNVVYADREGHIGLQTSGRIPRYPAPRLDGTRFRLGWDGSEEWDGFIPFAENPSTFDPPQGWLASANNPTLARSPYYISDQWEPVDRIRRIHELIRATDRLSVADVARMQSDTVLVPARELVPLVLDAYRGAPPRGPVGAALERLRGWDFDMRGDAAAPLLFALFERRLYEAIFADEMGAELAKDWRSKANLWAIMVATVVERRLDHWFDRVSTPGREDRGAIFRAAFEAAVKDAMARFGDDPGGARWSDAHTLTFHSPLGRGSRLLALYFDRGPFGVPGHAGTVNKMETPFDGLGVTIGPSMRQITDFSDLDASLAVLPGGQSGIPASHHYDDLMQLWLRGEYHPWPISRQAVERIASARLVLEPE